MNSRFKFFETCMAGLCQIERKPIGDTRGYLSRFFCAKEFEAIGFKSHIAQINQTLTRKKGTVRGLHFQYPPSSEAKIVSCTRGRIFDVAVDIRQNSPTFLQWYALELSPDNQMSLYIPPGFAHGFQSLEEDCELLYIHSDFYQPELEGALNILDKKIAVDWPLEISEISPRDRSHKMIEDFRGIECK